MTFYFNHYVSQEKWRKIKQKKGLTPTAPFNSRITDEKWSSYAGKFPFPVAQFYTCAFFEPEPRTWKEHGFSSEVWRQRAVRDSHPELREKWLASTICLRDYQENYVCPEVLIHSTILLERIAVVGQWRL